MYFNIHKGYYTVVSFSYDVLGFSILIKTALNGKLENIPLF